MHGIVEEILAAEREHSLGVQPLSATDRDRLRERIFSVYGGRSNRLWATVNGCASVQNSDAWQWIREFVGPRSCILFFDLIDDVAMFHVPSGDSLDELLGSTFGFVFYVTDADCSYLIGFNDHDFLVCCGDARAWIEQRAHGTDSS
jgi:hypothetical protein